MNTRRGMANCLEPYENVAWNEKKDFWCLTFITLLQMAGIFDVALNEKLRYMINSAMGLVAGIYLGVMGKAGPCSSAQDVASRLVLASALVIVQLVVFATLLCPLAFIYVFGILISAGLSLWRLIEHDYLGNSEGEAPNLVPALDTLYYLALLQGVLFLYKFSLGYTGKWLVKEVATKCDDSEIELVKRYLRETRSGCEKDPSFAKGRNLITHAVDMIGSHSPSECDAGVKILYTAISIVERNLNQLVVDGRKSSDDYREEKYTFSEQQKLMKHLLLSTSSSRHILQKLLETLDSRGTHDRATRNKAAMIVERIALDIKLEQFPGRIEHISSLIGTFQEYSVAEPFQRERQSDISENTWELSARRLPPSQRVHRELHKAYKELLLQGLCILWKLAADGNNCRIMSDTQDLVSKIMAPVTSDLLQHTIDNHGAWSDIVEGSMKVMIQLTGAPGETGTKLRHEISSCKEAINTLLRIISCKKCNQGLKQRAIQILTQLYMDTESSRCGAEFVVISSCSREDFVRILVDIFTHDNKSVTIRKYAGAALSVLCFHGGISDATTVIETGGGDVIDSLAKVLVHDKNTTCRQTAATILQHLCTQYTKDNACSGKLKKAIADAMPEVIGEILRCGEPKHNGKEAGQDGFAKTKIDIENQCDNSQGQEFFSSTSSHPQNDEHDVDKVLQAIKESIWSSNILSSLLSLCGTVMDMFIPELAPDLARQFHESSFIDNLKDIVDKKSDHPTVENLLLLKTIGKMVISTMKHNGGNLVRQDDLRSLIAALSSTSNKMLELDYSMVFQSANSCGTIEFTTVTPSKLNGCTLASIVEEAQELHGMMSA
ncbi:unnamed protein product [Alopecurus aequalis]